MYSRLTMLYFSNRLAANMMPLRTPDRSVFPHTIPKTPNTPLPSRTHVKLAGLYYSDMSTNLNSLSRTTPPTSRPYPGKCVYHQVIGNTIMFICLYDKNVSVGAGDRAGGGPERFG